MSMQWSNNGMCAMQKEIQSWYLNLFAKFDKINLESAFFNVSFQSNFTLQLQSFEGHNLSIKVKEFDKINQTKIKFVFSF